MTVEEKTQALLIAASVVTSLVPAVRIAVRSDQQNITAPYIAHQMTDADPQYVMESLIARARYGYQVSIFSSSYSGGSTVAAAVVAALTGTHSGFTYFWRGRSYSFEADTALHHFADSWEVFG